MADPFLSGRTRGARYTTSTDMTDATQPHRAAPSPCARRMFPSRAGVHRPRAGARSSRFTAASSTRAPPRFKPPAKPAIRCNRRDRHPSCPGSLNVSTETGKREWTVNHPHLPPLPPPTASAGPVITAACVPRRVAPSGAPAAPGTFEGQERFAAYVAHRRSRFSARWWRRRSPIRTQTQPRCARWATASSPAASSSSRLIEALLDLHQ